MRKALLITVGFLMIYSYAGAQELFEECSKVINEDRYKVLSDYLSGSNKECDLCQRLNNKEFLYSDYENIYYCKAENGALSCEEHKKGTWFQQITVARRFLGKNGKRYVLLRTAGLSHGVFGSGYHIFFLVPKSVNPRGYVISRLQGAGEYNGLYSDGGEICDNLNDADKAVSGLSPPFETINEGQSNPIVRFNQQITSCKSGESSNQILEYTYQDWDFRKTLDRMEAVQTRDRGTHQVESTTLPPPAKTEPAKLAPAPKLNRFTGTIVKVDAVAKTFKVKGKNEEKVMTFVTDDKTKTTKGKEVKAFADLEAGMDVIVVYNQLADKNLAVAVKIAMSKAEAPTHSLKTSSGQSIYDLGLTLGTG